MNTILITGGSSGIGRRVYTQLLEDNYRCVIVDSIPADNLIDDTEFYKCDLSTINEIDKLKTHLKNKDIMLNGLVLSAGIAKFQDFVEVTEEDFDSIVSVNLKGVFFTIQKLISLLRDNSSIVIIGSIAGSKGIKNSATYSASKAALRSLARTLTQELSLRNIRVNVVSPGLVDTNFLRNALQNPEDYSKTQESLQSMQSMSRAITTEDVSNMCLFLLSDKSSAIRGSEIFVDGGLCQI